MLMTMKEVLTIAQENKFAVGAFNVGNGEFLRAILETSEEKRSPVILAIHPSELDFLTDGFIAYCRDAANRTSIPVVIHLDHGGTLQQVVRALRCGFTSVMFDGSALPYEENIKLTRTAVEIAHSIGIPVEGELGTVGQAEGSIESGENEILYTEPDQAADFVAKTGIDSLAVAIGTAHGMYPKNRRPKLQLDRLRKISSIVEIPLVLHGGSDNDPNEVAESTSLGICKVNISSEMKKAFFMELRKVLVNDPNQFEPIKLFTDPIIAAKNLIAQKIELFGSSNKLNLYR